MQRHLQHNIVFSENLGKSGFNISYGLLNHIFNILAVLTHWGRVTHLCVGSVTFIGTDNGLSPGRRQAIIWTNAGILLTGSLWTNLSEMIIETHTFSFKKIHLKISSAKWRPFYLGLNVVNLQQKPFVNVHDPYYVHSYLLWTLQRTLF